MPNLSSAPERRQIVLLGATGSVGRQAVELLSRHHEQFEVLGLAAGGSDLKLLAEQALSLRVRQVAVARAELAGALTVALREQAAGASVPQVLAGPEAAAELATAAGHDPMRPVVVLNAITGAIGLAPTLAALAAGHTLALANKESLIIGGPLVQKLAGPEQIVPVDSEHSAIAQCLRGGRSVEVKSLILTASGGPLRGWTRDQLELATPEQAIAHPTWDMGRVISTNSATLVNKGLEVIEAHLLFGIGFDRIQVVVHPQSVVHSMVEFVDGSILAQCSPPDMRLPIALGLAWPNRIPAAAASCDWRQSHSWQFEPLDELAFPAVALAREVGTAGSTYPAVYNAANEVCVDAFHAGKIRFTDIVETIARVVQEHPAPSENLSLGTVLAADSWARSHTHDILTR